MPGDRTRSDYTWGHSVANTEARMARECSRAGNQDRTADCTGYTLGCNSADTPEPNLPVVRDCGIRMPALAQPAPYRLPGWRGSRRVRPRARSRLAAILRIRMATQLHLERLPRPHPRSVHTIGPCLPWLSKRSSHAGEIEQIRVQTRRSRHVRKRSGALTMGHSHGALGGDVS